MTMILVLMHAGLAAMWLGAMGYSLFVVQPKLSRLARRLNSVQAQPSAYRGGGLDREATPGQPLRDDPARIEELHRELAHGNRWPVTGVIAALWATGLLIVRDLNALVLVKAAALAGATGLFWWISWRAWPRRIFALPEELPALHRTFRRAAIAMFALVALAFVAGVLLRG